MENYSNGILLNAKKYKNYINTIINMKNINTKKSIRSNNNNHAELLRVSCWSPLHYTQTSIQ